MCVSLTVDLVFVGVFFFFPSSSELSPLLGSTVEGGNSLFLEDFTQSLFFDVQLC